MSIIDFRRLAKEAGFTDHYSADMWGVMLAHDIEIERFAKLVAEAEREACAKIAEVAYRQYKDTKEAHEKLSPEPFRHELYGFSIREIFLSKEIAYEIRARGKE